MEEVGLRVTDIRYYASQPWGMDSNLLLGFFVGLSSGATVIISQYYGARSIEGVSHTVHTAAAMALLLSAL